MRTRVRRWTGERLYVIDQVLGDMVTRCRELGLRLRGPEDQARLEFTTLLAAHDDPPPARPPPGAAVTPRRVKEARRKLRVLALVHDLVRPTTPTSARPRARRLEAKYDVVHALRALGHEVQVLGIGGDLGPLRSAIADWKPQIAFDLVEAFDDVSTVDANVVAYLELIVHGLQLRGLVLARGKAITKEVLSYHRVPRADFAVVARDRNMIRPRRLRFPLFVKSLTLDASLGISQATVVGRREARGTGRFVHESVGTDALVEEYIEGRELYVGTIGDERIEVPVWEL